MLSFRIALDTASKLDFKAETSMKINFGENVNFTGNRMNIKIAGLFIQKFSDLLRLLPSLEKEIKISGSIRLLEPATLDSSKIIALTPLSNVIFRLRVERSD